jgi:hypothetical protein
MHATYIERLNARVYKRLTPLTHRGALPADFIVWCASVQYGPIISVRPIFVSCPSAALDPTIATGLR